MLVGNKIDLEDDRKVSYEEAKALAELHKMHYFETSAKLNKNIDELMIYLMEQVYKKMFLTGGDDDRFKSVVIKPNDPKGGKKKDGGSKCC